MNIKECQAEIDNAFQAVKRPTKWLHPQSYDDTELKPVYEYLTWKEIPDQVISSQNAALCFAGPDSFRYLLPAYMQFALNHIFTSDFGVDSAIYALSPDRPEDPFQESKYTLLTPEQTSAIRSFLSVMLLYPDHVDEKHARLAAEYWRSRQSTEPGV